MPVMGKLERKSQCFLMP